MASSSMASSSNFRMVDNAVGPSTDDMLRTRLMERVAAHRRAEVDLAALKRRTVAFPPLVGEHRSVDALRASRATATRYTEECLSTEWMRGPTGETAAEAARRPLEGAFIASVVARCPRGAEGLAALAVQRARAERLAAKASMMREVSDEERFFARAITSAMSAAGRRMWSEPHQAAWAQVLRSAARRSEQEIVYVNAEIAALQRGEERGEADAAVELRSDKQERVRELEARLVWLDRNATVATTLARES